MKKSVFKQWWLWLILALAIVGIVSLFLNAALAKKIREELPYAAVVTVDRALWYPEISISPEAGGERAFFGDKIYHAVNTCNSVMAEKKYGLIVIYNDSDGVEQMRFQSDPNNYGVIDRKVGYATKKITIKDLQALIREFPALDATINLEKALDDDVDLYNRIFDALDAEPLRDEDEIIYEFVESECRSYDELKWFLTYMLGAAYSDHFEPNPYNSSTKEYIDSFAVDADAAIFSSPASENGLADTVMRVNGVVSRHYVFEDFSTVEISTESGPVCVFINNEIIDSMSEDICPEISWENWHTMQDGSPVCCYFKYLGFSGVSNSASGIFLYADGAF